MLVNPYAKVDFGVVRLANFHTHAGTGPNTCGAYEIPEVLKLYKDTGYSILTISNHNLYTDPAPYKDCGMCLVPGYEYTTSTVHLVCVGTGKVEMSSHQAAVDSAIADGGFAIMCHPNWFNGKEILPREYLYNVRRYLGMEILNGGCEEIRPPYNGTPSSGLATDVYDEVLSSGRLIWAFGSDDFHRWWHFARAFNIYFCDLTPESVIAASKAGEFYVSTGLLLTSLDYDGKFIRVQARHIRNYRDILRFRFIGKNGHILAEAEGESATYMTHGDEDYVRIEAVGRTGAMLWTQPLYNPEKLKMDE
ncbi:MAG TPA: hypothetical protein PK778_02785 [Bacillota bacterium]|nr:hypothetical protein [Clostridiales bacterium]HPT84904.1 hypothetical protein [Bacillota bacterium]